MNIIKINRCFWVECLFISKGKIYLSPVCQSSRWRWSTLLHWTGKLYKL